MGKSIMTGISLSSSELDPRRKRMLFRAWRRGTREMDLLLGGFADLALKDMADDDLGLFEHLLEAPDKDIYAWISGKAAVPANYDTDVFRAVLAYSNRAREN
jgi:antitoxin CptB